MAPSDEDEEKPLDPAVERVQAKLRRLILISGLTLGLGLLAVFLAILYRITTVADKAAEAPPAALVERAVEAALPAGAHLVSATTAGGRIALAYEHGGDTTLILIDPASLAIVGRLELKSGGSP